MWFKEDHIFRNMFTSKLISNGETTVPKPVRDALRLGVTLVYELDEDEERVILTKERKANPFVAFKEWNSAEERRRMPICSGPGLSSFTRRRRGASRCAPRNLLFVG